MSNACVRARIVSITRGRDAMEDERVVESSSSTKIIARASSSSRASTSTTGVDRRAETVTFRRRLDEAAATTRTRDEDVVVTVRQNRGRSRSIGLVGVGLVPARVRVPLRRRERRRTGERTTRRRAWRRDEHAGIGVLKLGAASVTLTDLPSELALLEENVKLNACPGDSPVCVRACAWGELTTRQRTDDTVVGLRHVLYHQPVRVLEALANTLRALVDSR